MFQVQVKVLESYLFKFTFWCAVDLNVELNIIWWMIGLDSSEYDIVEWNKCRIADGGSSKNDMNMKGIVVEYKSERTNGNMCKQ